MARYFTERTVEQGTTPIVILAVRTEQLDGTDTASQCRDELSHYEPPGNVIIDLGNALTIESSVIGGMLALNKAARRQGYRLCICNAGEQVVRLLTVTKLDKLMQVTETEEEAILALSADAGS